MIRQLWAEMGGSWAGKVREGVGVARRRASSTCTSPSRSPRSVRDINKFSNNVMARQLYLTLAAEIGGAPARAEDAARVDPRSGWRSRSITAPELVLENGSGPVAHRAHQRRAPGGAPAGGVAKRGDAGIRRPRCRSWPPTARCGSACAASASPAARTSRPGCCTDARAIAGYVLDRHGRRHVVVMIVNHPNAPRGRAGAGCAARSGSTKRGRARARAPARSHRPRRFTSASMAIGRPQRRAVSPGHLLVASMPILRAEARDRADAKSR